MCTHEYRYVGTCKYQVTHILSHYSPVLLFNRVIYVYITTQAPSERHQTQLRVDDLDQINRIILLFIVHIIIRRGVVIP